MSLEGMPLAMAKYFKSGGPTRDLFLKMKYIQKRVQQRVTESDVFR